jgi:hypothetical protein
MLLLGVRSKLNPVTFTTEPTVPDCGLKDRKPARQGRVIETVRTNKAVKPVRILDQYAKGRGECNFMENDRRSIPAARRLSIHKSAQRRTYDYGLPLSCLPFPSDLVVIQPARGRRHAQLFEQEGQLVRLLVDALGERAAHTVAGRCADAQQHWQA